MCTDSMPRSDKEFRLDDRILAALKRVKEKTGMPVNSYVENLLFHHLKGVGEIPMTEQPLPEARGGKRQGAGKPKKSKDEAIAPADVDPMAQTEGESDR